MTLLLYLPVCLALHKFIASVKAKNTIGLYIHGPQRMNPIDSGDHLTFSLYHQQVTFYISPVKYPSTASIECLLAFLFMFSAHGQTSIKKYFDGNL